MPSLDHNLARIIRLLATTIAVIVAISLPLGYWTLAYEFEASTTEAEAEVQAAFLTQRINANPAMWRYEVPRLDALLVADFTPSRLPEMHVILDEHGTVLAQREGTLVAPVLSRSADLLDSGRVVGQYVVSRSLVPLVLNTGLTLLFALALALGAYFSLSMLPLRALGRAQSALQLEQERLRAIVDKAIEGIITVDPQGVVESFNPAAEQMFGYHRSEIVGRHIDEIMHRPSLEVAHAALGSHAGTQEAVGKRKDGVTFPVELASSKSTLERGAKSVIIARDITERKLADEALRRSAEEYRSILATTTDGFMVVDEGSRLLDVNDAYCGLTGYTREELLAMSVQQLDAVESGEDVAERVGEILKRGTGRFVTQHRCKDGRVIDVEVSVTYVPSSKRMFCFISDITERKRAEEELRRSQQELRGLSKAANEALESERRRTARELHDELGQLLTALKMDLQSLYSALPSDEPDLAKRAQAMHALLDGTIAATRRIATNLRPLMLDDLGLAAALDWLVNSFSGHSGIATDLVVDETVAQIGEPVASALYRITQESLTNITKYAQATTAEIRVERDGEWVQLVVRDNGRGIDEADQRKRGAFGLVGIRERATLLGGEVAITGQPGCGSEVRVRIPLAAAESELAHYGHIIVTI